jgi:hypothetical protein
VEGTRAARQSQISMFGGVRATVGAVVTLLMATALASCASTAEPSTDALASGARLATVLPTPSPSATAAASPSPSPGEGGGPADGWVEVGSFGNDEGIDAVHAVVEAPFGLLAAGVHIRARNLNVFGELPWEGRTWLSSDGTSWEDVTPAGTFADASVDRLVVLPDGAVVAFGSVNVVDPVSGSPTTEYAEWETADGRTWTAADISHGPSPVHDIVQGGRGYLAAISVEFKSQLMHSGDGRTFVEVADEASARVARGLGGGPEGFVVIVQAYESAEAPGAYASGNGTDWFKATTPDWNPVGVAPLGADWVVAEVGPFDDLNVDTHSRTWLSANGLDWAESGGVPLRSVPLSDEFSCREFVSGLTSTGSMVVLSTTLSYPCGEGNVQSFGTSSVTTDGETWMPLSFTERETAYDEASRGATVTAGLEVASGTVLVGESGYRATFWFRPAD